MLGVNGSILCVFCNLHVESSGHLFFHCPCTFSLWSRILIWLGVDCILPLPASISHLLVLFGEGLHKKVDLGGCLMLWHVIIWCIWEIRNVVIFGKESFDLIYLLDRVKVYSWRWFSASNHSYSCFFSDWCIDPFNWLAS